MFLVFSSYFFVDNSCISCYDLIGGNFFSEIQSSDLSKTSGAHQVSLNDNTADVYALRVSNIQL